MTRIGHTLNGCLWSAFALDMAVGHVQKYQNMGGWSSYQEMFCHILLIVRCWPAGAGFWPTATKVISYLSSFSTRRTCRSCAKILGKVQRRPVIPVSHYKTAIKKACGTVTHRHCPSSPYIALFGPWQVKHVKEMIGFPSTSEFEDVLQTWDYIESYMASHQAHWKRHLCRSIDSSR